MEQSRPGTAGAPPGGHTDRPPAGGTMHTEHQVQGHSDGGPLGRAPRSTAPVWSPSARREQADPTTEPSSSGARARALTIRRRARVRATPSATVAVGAAAVVGVSALAVSDRPALWAVLVALEVLVLALVAAAAGLGTDRASRAWLLLALVVGSVAALLVGPELPQVSFAAAAALAWPASLLVALVSRDADEGPADVIALRRPVLAGAALLVGVGAVAVSGLAAAAVAFAAGLPLALLVLQLADAGPVRSHLRRWSTAAALVVGAVSTVLAAVLLGDPGDGAGPLVVLAAVLAVASAVEVLTRRRRAGASTTCAAVVLAAAAIGAAPGGLVAVGVALLAGGAWVRTRFPQPAAIPQLLIDLTDGPGRLATAPSAPGPAGSHDQRSPAP